MKGTEKVLQVWLIKKEVYEQFIFIFLSACRETLTRFRLTPEKTRKKVQGFRECRKKVGFEGSPDDMEMFRFEIPFDQPFHFPRSFPRGEDTFVFEAYSPCQEKWENVSFFRSKFAIASTNPLLSWGNSIDFFTIIRFFNRLLRTRLNDEFVARNKKLLLLAVCFASRDNVFVTRSGK